MPSSSTAPVDALMRVAPSRPVLRTAPTAMSPVTREPVGSSTRRSIDSDGPITLKRGLGPLIVRSAPSNSTTVSSAPRRSTDLAGLVGETVTTVSVRSLAMISMAPTGRWIATSRGVGVSNLGMPKIPFSGRWCVTR